MSGIILFGKNGKKLTAEHSNKVSGRGEAGKNDEFETPRVRVNVIPAILSWWGYGQTVLDLIFYSLRTVSCCTTGNVCSLLIPPAWSSGEGMLFILVSLLIRLMLNIGQGPNTLPVSHCSSTAGDWLGNSRLYDAILFRCLQSSCCTWFSYATWSWSGLIRKTWSCLNPLKWTWEK